MSERITNGLYDDAIRKEWVSKVTDEFKEQLLGLPQQVRFETYKSIDRLIAEEFLKLISKRRSELEALNSGKVYNKETDTHQFTEELDVVATIAQATQNVIEDF